MKQQKSKNYWFKIKSFALLFLIGMIVFFKQANAEEDLITSDGFKYIENWDGKYCITGYQGEGGDITVPGKINGKKVTSIASNAFKDNETITQVTIGEGIEEMGNETFGNCRNLTQISIPASMKRTLNAFVSCEKLMKFKVAKKNKIFYTIDGVLIAKCKDWVLLYAFPGGREGAYTIPKKVTAIGERAFSGAVNLTKVTIPRTCKAIFPNAFDSCNKLNTVSIEKGGVTYLDHKVFAHCTSLEKVYISSDVAGIGSGPFMGCTKLSTVNIDKNNKYMTISKGVIYSKDKNYKRIFQLLPSVKLKNGVFVVPNDVCTVACGAFGEIEGLTTIDFSKSKVKEFDNYYYQFLGVKNATVLIKKGSELAKTINEEVFNNSESYIKFKFVK